MQSTQRLRRHPRRVVVAILVCVAIGLLGWQFRGIDDFVAPADPVELTFSTPMAELSGSLFLPEGDASSPVVLFVHGDGPADRLAGDNYNPLINAFIDAGIGVFSWDKPGVGQSTGNWLDQSMDDRADEALAALAAVRSTTSSGDAIGFLGFSQAGWVLPKVAAKTDDETFFVIAGGASNWQDQGDYFGRVRMQGEGLAEAEIERRIVEGRVQDRAIYGPPPDYAAYLATTTSDAPMSEERFAFAARNVSADATDELEAMTAPVLAIWGEDDLNVDALHEVEVYGKALRGPDQEAVLWPDATHGLTRSSLGNYQLESQWSLLERLRAAGAGRRLFAPGVIDFITDWILRRS